MSPIGFRNFVTDFVTDNIIVYLRHRPQPPFPLPIFFFDRAWYSENNKQFLSMAAASSRLNLNRREIIVIKNCLRKYLSTSTTPRNQTLTLLSNRRHTSWQVYDFITLSVIRMQSTTFRPSLNY